MTSTTFAARAACTGLAALLWLAAPATLPVALAQTAEPSTSTAVGSTSTWNTNVAPAGGTGQVTGLTLDAAQTAAVGEISAYFNTLTDLRGSFLQTDPDQKSSKGKFFMQRPGKFRFTYGSPSTLEVVSDGETLAFEDKEAASFDRYSLDSTPFRLLLQKDVDLMQSAVITDFYQDADLLTVALRDRSDDSTGQIKLFFIRNAGGLDLKEWVVTDPQGGDTRVEFADLVKGEKPADETFTLSDVFAGGAQKQRK